MTGCGVAGCFRSLGESWTCDSFSLCMGHASSRFAEIDPGLCALLSSNGRKLGVNSPRNSSSRSCLKVGAVGIPVFACSLLCSSSLTSNGSDTETLNDRALGCPWVYGPLDRPLSGKPPFSSPSSLASPSFIIPRADMLASCRLLDSSLCLLFSRLMLYRRLLPRDDGPLIKPIQEPSSFRHPSPPAYTSLVSLLLSPRSNISLNNLSKARYSSSFSALNLAISSSSCLLLRSKTSTTCCASISL